jgi:hypothetical protein
MNETKRMYAKDPHPEFTIEMVKIFHDDNLNQDERAYFWYKAAVAHGLFKEIPVEVVEAFKLARK